MYFNQQVYAERKKNCTNTTTKRMDFCPCDCMSGNFIMLCDYCVNNSSSLLVSRRLTKRRFRIVGDCCMCNRACKHCRHCNVVICDHCSTSGFVPLCKFCSAKTISTFNALMPLQEGFKSFLIES